MGGIRSLFDHCLTHCVNTMAVGAILAVTHQGLKIQWSAGALLPDNHGLMKRNRKMIFKIMRKRYGSHNALIWSLNMAETQPLPLDPARSLASVQFRALCQAAHLSMLIENFHILIYAPRLQNILPYPGSHMKCEFLHILPILVQIA